MNTRQLFIAAVMASAGLTAMASTPREEQRDSLLASTRVISLSGTEVHPDSIRSLMETFYTDQFLQFDNPSAPYFMFMTKEGDMAMGIGGCAKIRGWADWGHAVIDGPGFMPYKIPMQADPTARRNIGANPSGTSIFLRVMGRNPKWGNYQIFIQGEFNGYNERDFVLTKAYAQWNDWTVGYATSTFCDVAAIPPTVDAQGPNNKLDVNDVLVRWTHTWREHLTVAGAVEAPLRQISVDGVSTASVKHWMPDLAAFVQWQWGKAGSQHVRLSGITRQLVYRDLVADRNHSSVGWGLQLSTVFNIAPAVTFYGSANGGYGMAGLGGDLMAGAYDMVGDPSTPGRMYAPGMFGWMGALQWHIKRNLFVYGAWAQTRYYPDHDVPGDEYRYGQYGSAGVFYNPIPRVQIGGGFSVGRRSNFDHEARWARRINLQASFDF